MKTISFPAQRLEALFQDRKVATLPQLKGALGSDVDLTVFRKLSALPYRVARLDFSGGVYLDVWRNGSGGGTGGRCPPGPLGFIAFMLLQQKVAPGDPGGHPAFCCLQPPDGARVASPQSPILRWRKGGPLHDGGEGPFPFPLPWRSIGRASWERGWAGGPSPELSGARLELLRL